MSLLVATGNKNGFRECLKNPTKVSSQKHPVSELLDLASSPCVGCYVREGRASLRDLARSTVEAKA